MGAQKKLPDPPMIKTEIKKIILILAVLATFLAGGWLVTRNLSVTLNKGKASTQETLYIIGIPQSDVPLLQGFVHGFRTIFPNNDLVARLKPKLWRTGYSPEKLPIIQFFGPKITWETSPNFYGSTGTWFNDCNGNFGPCSPEQCVNRRLPINFNDPASVENYKKFIYTTTLYAVENNLNIDYWDWWSEPDDYGRFGTQEQMFQAFKIFHDAIRQVERKTGKPQKIVAPSISNFAGIDWRSDNDCPNFGLQVPPGTRTFKLEDFLAFVEQNNLRLDALSWHEFAMPESIGQQIQEVRRYLGGHPALCNPTCPEIHINEYQGLEQTHLPGASVAWLSSLEKNGVKWASRSCWIVGGVDGCNQGLDGLFLADGQTPQANYWVHLAYANMDGLRRIQPQLFFSNNNQHLVGLGAIDDNQKQVGFLLGRYCNAGSKTWQDCFGNGLQKGPAADVTVAYIGYPFSTNRIRVEVYQIPNNNNQAVALNAPVLISTQELKSQYLGSSLQFTIPNFADFDAYIVLIKYLEPK